MSATFPETAVTLIAKIKDLGPASDSAAWVRFWNAYSGAIRQFAAMKGGEENADDIVMLVLGKLVDVLRKGQYTPEKGRFHSYLATMIVNEVHMLHRRNVARGNDRRVSIDALHDDHDGEGARSVGETLVAAEESPEAIDAAWRQAVLKSAVERRDIAEVARTFGISRNSVSQIKTRIDKRIVSVGRELIRGA